MINSQIQITSLAKAVTNAKRTGKLDTKIIKLFSTMTYALSRAEQFASNGSEQFDDVIVNLKKELGKLQYKYPSVICNYKTVIGTDTINTPLPTTGNTAPTVDSNTIDIEELEVYDFSNEDFLLNFNDAENHSWKFLIIYPNLSMTGTLRRGRSIIELPQVINMNRPGAVANINYERGETGTFTDLPFTFRVSDDPLDFLYSSLQTMTMTSTVALESNLAPTDVGDNTIYVGNQAVTVLTLFMFTGGLVAPYNDPEGDLIDAIRIIDISNANQGVYKVNGTEVTEGQIITREEIEAGLFTHEAASVSAITSDTFEFEARDEGSQIWIG